MRASSNGKAVLYIDDNPANLLLLQRIIAERPKIRFLSTSLGREGVALPQEHVPDLILLDLHLPDMHGDQVLSCLRHHPRTAKIPVVMISADAIGGEIDRLMELGACAYINKPFEVIHFLDILEDALAGVCAPRPRVEI